jgi:hypothetical protein
MKLFRLIRSIILPIINVRKMYNSLCNYPSFIRDYMMYSRLLGSERISLYDAYPCLHDKTNFTCFDRHYVFLNAWAFRIISSLKPFNHLDVGSQVNFVSMLSAVVPTVFIDFRPIRLGLSGLINLSGDILRLPFADKRLESVSCLHVIEHIGLGRYGDPLDARGSEKAMIELSRIIAPKGNLLIGLPIGKKRVCFNAHRICSPLEIADIFLKCGLTLKEFSVVDDNGVYKTNTEINNYCCQEYACGMFWLVRQ